MAVEPWVTPAVGSAVNVYRNRALIMKALKLSKQVVLGRRVQIPVTGLPGVGKSVLADELTGGVDRDYVPPSTSIGVEKRKRRVRRRTLKFVVVPGQMSPQRIAALDELFRRSNRQNGVLHVVANGYTSIRQTASAETLVDEGLDNIGKFRDNQREREIVDLRLLATDLSMHYGRHRVPFWMVVAVNKADLYNTPPAEAEARAHYARDGGPFYEELKAIQAQLGSDNFRFEVVQASALSEAFVWQDDEVPSSLDHENRAQLQGNLYRLVEELGVSL